MNAEEFIKIKEERDRYLDLLKEFADEYNFMASYPAITKKEIADSLNPIAKKIFDTLDKIEEQQ